MGKRRLQVARQVVFVSLLFFGGPWLSHAGFGGTDLFLPSVGSGEGSGSSSWSTTVWIHNPGEASAHVQISFLARNQPNPDPVVLNEVIDAGATRKYDDALLEIFAVQGFGAMRVQSDQRVVANARIHSTAQGESEAQSVGQFFAAVPAGFAIGSGQSTSLLGVYQTSPSAESPYRYNFGFVEVVGGDAEIVARAYDGNGVQVAEAGYSIAAFEPRQYGIADLVPEINASNLRIEVEAVGGSGRVIVFGSGLANQSNDPSTFEMLFDDTADPAGIAEVIAGDGLSGGGSIGTVVLQVEPGDGLEIIDDAVVVAEQGIVTEMIGEGAVTQEVLAAEDAADGRFLASDGTELFWARSMRCVSGKQAAGAAPAPSVIMICTALRD